MKEERFEKVVEWENDDFGFFITWFGVICSAIFFPVIYWFGMRKVYWRKIKK